MTQRDYANGTQTTWQYNPNNWVTELRHEKNSILLTGFAYDFDLEGNKKYEENLQNDTLSQQYGYDDIYRLTDFKRGWLDGSVNIPSPLDHVKYHYDALGNRDSVNTNGVMTYYAANSTNEYESIADNAGTASPAYDDNSNLTNDGVRDFTYDFENRVVTANGALITYEYDALGRRIQKTTAVDTVYYFFDSWRVVEERKKSGSMVSSFVYGTWIDDVLTMNRDGHSYYYHKNSLGSIVAISNDAGSVEERYQYDGYGNTNIYDSNYALLVASALNNPYGFTGRRWDGEAGIYYYRMRQYDQTHGRFIQRDPAGYIDGANLFEYVGGNAVKYIDPLGLCRVKITGDANDNTSYFTWVTEEIKHKSRFGLPGGSTTYRRYKRWFQKKNIAKWYIDMTFIAKDCKIMGFSKNVDNLTLPPGVGLYQSKVLTNHKKQYGVKFKTGEVLWNWMLCCCPEPQEDTKCTVVEGVVNIIWGAHIRRRERKQEEKEFANTEAGFGWGPLGWKGGGGYSDSSGEQTEDEFINPAGGYSIIVKFAVCPSGCDDCFVLYPLHDDKNVVDPPKKMGNTNLSIDNVKIE